MSCDHELPYDEHYEQKMQHEDHQAEMSSKQFPGIPAVSFSNIVLVYFCIVTQRMSIENFATLQLHSGDLHSLRSFGLRWGGDCHTWTPRGAVEGDQGLE
jgi:hypothetical protein